MKLLDLRIEGLSAIILKSLILLWFGHIDVDWSFKHCSINFRRRGYNFCWLNTLSQVRFIPERICPPFDNAGEYGRVSFRKNSSRSPPLICVAMYHLSDKRLVDSSQSFKWMMYIYNYLSHSVLISRIYLWLSQTYLPQICFCMTCGTLLYVWLKRLQGIILLAPTFKCLVKLVVNQCFWILFIRLASSLYSRSLSPVFASDVAWRYFASSFWHIKQQVQSISSLSWSLLILLGSFPTYRHNTSSFWHFLQWIDLAWLWGHKWSLSKNVEWKRHSILEKHGFNLLDFHAIRYPTVYNMTIFSEITSKPKKILMTSSLTLGINNYYWLVFHGMR